MLDTHHLQRKSPTPTQIGHLVFGQTQRTKLLAIDQTSKGQGLGQFLLLDALYRSLQAADAIAAMAVVVDAKDAGAAAFYDRYGFMPLSAFEGRMFLPMKTISALF